MQISSFFRNKKNKTLIILATCCVLIHIFSLYPILVEKYYSLNIYPFIARGLRFATRHIGFSLGDLLYTILGILLLIAIFRFVKRILNKEINKKYFIKCMYNTLFTCFILYFLFNTLWGLNYNRMGISSQLQLKADTSYTTKELYNITAQLAAKTNMYRKTLGGKIEYPNNTTLFNEAVLAYKNIETKYHFLHYSIPAIKQPIYNTLGAYLGYGGYYNPFTGEAQVNTVLPKFLLPYICCHEMAHQLGYATEDEANFTGYLAGSASNDPLFKYSVYLGLYRYANNELWMRDSSMAIHNYKQLDTLVKADLLDLQTFYLAHENPFEKGVSWFYNQFLKANQQPQGIDTYNFVTAWLIAYEKKYRTL